MEFGRRPQARRDKVAQPPTRNGPAAVHARGHGKALLFGVLFALALLFYPTMQIAADKQVALPRDLEPGLKVAAPPYERPGNCPDRVWSAGEYLPATCVINNVIAHSEAAQVGLEAPSHLQRDGRRRRWSGFRQRVWIRIGQDAVLIARPGGAAGEVLMVVSGRFADGAVPQVGDGGDYGAPPVDYLIRTAGVLIFPPVVALGMLGFGLWASKRWPQGS